MTQESTVEQLLLTSFNQVLEKALNRVETAECFDSYESALGLGAMDLSASIQAIGEESASVLAAMTSKSEGKTRVSASIISYLWVEEAKKYLILWRNALLEQQKAMILSLDNQIGKGAVKELSSRSIRVLKEAGAELLQLYEKEYARFNNVQYKKKQLSKWYFQSNPWDVYKDQIEQLATQCKEAEVHQNGLKNTTIGFGDIRQLVKQTIQTCKNELQRLKDLSKQIVSYIDEHIEEKPGMVATYMEESAQQMKIPSHINQFLTALKEINGQLATKMKVPIDTKGGIIQFKEVNFKKNAQQWLDSEIVPALHEIWELTENTEQSAKMSLLNIKNRAVLLSNEQKNENNTAFERGYYNQPLIALIKKIDDIYQEIANLENTVEQRLEEYFRLSKIYDTNQAFLPISLQSTLSQFTLSQNELIRKARTQLNKPTSFIKRFRDTVTEEETLSPAEKITRLLQNRSVDSENTQYTSIFQTKGYIGESFWVGREQELQRFNTLVEQWELGFRGACIISGERLSGKSLFGEVVANRYFQKRTIRLSPNTNLNLEGRKKTVSYDLKSALGTIKNMVYGKRFLIWIDDLELWQNPTIPLSRNIRSLIEHIDSNNAQFFYVVSINKWLLAHLQKTNNIDSAFQATITLDKMSVPEIQQAILIRHGATHKILVNKEGGELSTDRFESLSASVCRSANRNVGDALNFWAASIHKLDEDKVIHQSYSDFPMPDFLSPSAALLLTTIYRAKRINEYQLRRLFGAPFKDKYKAILQRLISIGVLTRQLDGMLEVNELIVNDLGRLLARKKYL